MCFSHVFKQILIHAERWLNTSPLVRLFYVLTKCPGPEAYRSWRSTLLGTLWLAQLCEHLIPRTICPNDTAAQSFLILSDFTTVTPGTVDPTCQGCNPPMSAVKFCQHVSILGWSLGHLLLETETTGQLFALGFPVVSYDNCSGHFAEAGWVPPPPLQPPKLGLVS